MVTKYDVFELMYSKGTIMKPQEIARAFKKKEYHSIYMILVDLEKKGLLSKSEYGFQVKRNQKNDLLYQMIKHCMSNSINYNELLDENLAEYISKAFLKKKFGINDFKISPRTYSKYFSILIKTGFLILVSRKPMIGLLPYNSFLGDLVSYFGKPVHARKIQDDEYFYEINSELEKFRRLSSQNLQQYQRTIDDFEIKFIHHSLSLEGNPITLPDTIKILKQQITPPNLKTEDVAEVQNYQKAIRQMMRDADERNPLTKDAVLNYHYLAMQHKVEIAGKIRTLPVHIKGNPDYDVAKVEDIVPLLDALFGRYNEFMQKNATLKEILKFASYFHNEFQHIHPFEDGNSRTTRLITFHLLRMQGIPIFDIPIGLLESYLFSTKGAKKRDDAKLDQVLQLIIMYNLKTINEKLI